MTTEQWIVFLIFIYVIGAVMFGGFLRRYWGHPPTDKDAGVILTLSMIYPVIIFVGSFILLFMLCSGDLRKKKLDNESTVSDSIDSGRP